MANVFTQVLFLCDAQGLIGREMFAIAKELDLSVSRVSRLIAWVEEAKGKT